MGKFGKSIIVRTLSGIALFAIVFFAVYASKYSFFALLLVIGGGCMYEFYRMVEKTGAKPLKLYSIITGLFIITIMFFNQLGLVSAKWFVGAIVPVFVVFVMELYRKKTDGHMANISTSLLGVFYAALPMALLCYMGMASGIYDPYFVLAYIFTVWVNDIFAYLVGVGIGKHRLFERISPKKSWEGFVGGLLFAVAFAILCGYWFGKDLIIWAGFGVVVVVSAVFGDLIESMFKREVGVKDSGSIMPGHGGFLDRFDALLFSAPFVFIYFYIFQ